MPRQLGSPLVCLPQVALASCRSAKPVVEACRPKARTRVGYQRPIIQFTAEVTCMDVGNDLAAVAPCSEVLARDFIERKTIGAGYFEGAVERRCDGQIGHRSRDVVGSDGLHQRRGKTRRRAVRTRVDNAADELEELRCAQDGVRDLRSLDQVFLGDLCAKVAAFKESISTYHGEREVVFHTSLGFGGEQVTA